MAELVLIDRPTTGVAVVTLNRPEKYNALSLALRRAFAAATAELAADAQLRAIVLTGADPAFCAGLGSERARQGEYNASSDGAGPLGNSPVPVIAAVNGVATTAAWRSRLPATSASPATGPDSPTRTRGSASSPAGA